MLFQVCEEWEYNGRDDSDFYIVAFNDETDSLERIEVGSTRYAGGRGYVGIVRLASVPADVMGKAELALKRQWAARLPRIDERARLADAAKVGTAVITTKAFTNRPRETVEVECFKCGGSGKWVHPRNPSDTRPCFGCKGTGKGSKSKACKGDSIDIEVGTKATVVAVFRNTSKYGTWDYGSTAVCRRADGTTFRARVDALIADRPAITPEEVESKAARIAARRDFYSPFATSSLSMVA